MIRNEIVFWASASRRALKYVLNGSKTPLALSKSRYNYDLRRNRLLDINVSRCAKIVLKNVLNGSKNPQIHSNSRGSYRLDIRVSLYIGIVLKNVLSQ